MAFLTPAQLAKAQAEAEGYQFGPQPSLNPANIYTQDKAGNPTAPTTSPTPYYPSSETPNLQLTTDEMPAALANNFVILDNLLPTGEPILAIPVISARIQQINATTTQSISLTSPITQMYAVSLYMSATGMAAAGHSVTVTIAYMCDLGPETITIALPLDTRNIIMETYPLLVLGGTTIVLSTAYTGGATNDPYNITARLVQMP
jgi:hypothetical protein